MKQFLFILILFITVHARTQTITLTGKNLPLSTIFTEIKKQTGYGVIYNPQLIQKSKSVSVTAQNQKLTEFLDVVLKKQLLDYTIEGKNIFIKQKVFSTAVDFKSTASDSDTAKKITVKGKVINEKGDPVITTITVKGTANAVSSNANGEFILTGVGEKGILLITSINMEAQELKVNGNTDLKTITVKTKVKEEETVVIANTGYQKVKPNEVNGSMSVIDNKTLNLQTGTNIIDRLNGVTPSLLFLSGKTTPKFGVSYTIRGLSTINADPRPLIVLDNFPYAGNINSLNPADVESVTILKDAAATSIYGARGGNGVIVITTKKGKFNQRTKVNVAYNTTIAPKPDLYAVPQVSAADYIDLEEYLFNHGFDFTALGTDYKALTPAVEVFLKRFNHEISAADSAAQINALKKIDYRDDLDKYFYQAAVTSQYSLSLDGGSNNIAWRISGNYDKIVSNLDEQSDRFILNFGNSYKPLKKMRLSFGLNYVGSKQTSGKNIPGRVRNAPYIDLVDEEGKSLATSAIPGLTGQSKPLRSSFADTAGSGKLLDWHYYPLDDYKHDINRSQTEGLSISLEANWELLKGLNLNTGYTWTKEWSTTERYADEKSFYARDLINRFTNLNTSPEKMHPIPIGGIGIFSNGRSISQVMRIKLDFNRDWRDHRISALAGMDVTEYVDLPFLSSTLYGYDREKGTSLPVDYKTPFSLFNNFGEVVIPGAQGDALKLTKEQVSVYGNFSYTYKDRYTLSGSARKDASNTFGLSTNDKWKPLWSAGLGWKVSGEPFYHLSSIPFLRITATWGYSGNISPESTALPILREGNNLFALGASQVYSPANPRLRWEKIRQLNIGVNFSLAKLLSGSVEYYQKNNTDLYGNAFVDYTNGFVTASLNASNTKNNGVEIALTVAKTFKQITWHSSVIYNYQVDKLVNYYVQQNRTAATDGNTFNAAYPTIGKPLFSITAYRWAGLSSNGLPQGYVNGKPSTSYIDIVREAETKGFSGSSIVYMGHSTPPHFGSLVNRISWKGFGFSFIIKYAFGYYFKKKLILSSQDILASGNIPPDYVKRWQKPGDELLTEVPAFIYPDVSNGGRDRFYGLSEVNVLKADNIRLQGDLGLSYSLTPAKKKVFEQLQVRLAMGGLNGAIWAANKEGLDPENPDKKIGLFVNRSFSIGLNASF